MTNWGSQFEITVFHVRFGSKFCLDALKGLSLSFSVRMRARPHYLPFTLPGKAFLGCKSRQSHSLTRRFQQIEAKLMRQL